MPRTKTIKVIAVEIPRYGQLKDPLPINAYLNVSMMLVIGFNKAIFLNNPSSEDNG